MVKAKMFNHIQNRVRGKRAMMVRKSGIEFVVRGEPLRALKIPNAAHGHRIGRCSLRVKSHSV